PAAEAARLVRTLALAVQHAHEQKIVHRDLKPGNILLSRSSTDFADSTDLKKGAEFSSSESVPSVKSVDLSSAKITDCCLAKRLEGDSTAVTQEGDVLGTASYMAPEQATGRVGEIGPGVDVYALGAILYEMLTGQPPFQATTWNETVQMVIHDE